MMRKKVLVSGAFLLGALGLVGCGMTDNEVEEPQEETVEVSEDSETEATETSSEVEAHYTTSVNQELIDEHNERYEDIMNDFQNGEYTLEEPLVVQDPYGRSPLSALVLFETEESMEITVTVEGQDEQTTISNTYSGFETEHEIPVLGLYPELDNQVTITAQSENEDVNETNLTMSTEPVPEDLLDFTVEVSQPDQMQEGLTFVSPSRAYPAGVDSNGDVRWYSSQKSYNLFKRLENGNVLLATQEEGREDYDTQIEMSMLGEMHQAIQIDMENVLFSPTLHHDTIILPNDNYLVLLHDGSDEYVEDDIAELDRETGGVVQRINLRDVFPDEVYEEYDGQQADVGDWIHVNAIWKLEDEDAVLLSARQQDAIVKLTYPEGEIDWIFAYPDQWHEELDEYLLESTDEDLKYPAGQHAVMEVPDQDDNPDTLDIMLFDNNNILIRGDEEVKEEYSRAVQYRIDQNENTVEEVWSYGEERGEELYTAIVSDADFMPESGNVLINFGRTLDEEAEERYSVITEVTKDDESEVVYELHYGPFSTDGYTQIYRAERMPLYPKSE